MKTAPSTPANPEAPLQRYLAFAGSIYYPEGGMEDFYRDFADLPEAIHSVLEHAQKYNDHLHSDKRDHSWAHIYDTATRSIVWLNTDKHFPTS